MLGARNRRTPESLAKLMRRDVRELRKIGVNQRGIRLKIRIRGHRSFPVPRTDILANVATEKVSADSFAHIFRNRSTLLDGEVCNAARRVELPWRDKGFGRASVDAARASATTVRRDLKPLASNKGGVVERGNDNSEK